MRIFIAGATGALGGHLIPRLVAGGHEVTGMTRSAAKADALRALGACPAVADALDAEGLAAAVAVAEPEVIVHQLTALSGDLDLRHFERTFAQTDRLRRRGRTICSPRGGPSGCAGWWRRATPAGRSPAPGAR